MLKLIINTHLSLDILTTMAQAKTLSEKEFKVALAVVAQGRHPKRDRAMLLTSFWAGMRVGEIAGLTIGDVMGSDGSIKNEIRLTADQTKGNRGRTVMLGDRLRRELATYVRSLKRQDADRPLFYSQRCRTGFTANTLCQHFHFIYKRAGIDGASSHSGRRTFITTLANKGVGVRVLMALAGHRNMSTTQRYIDLNEEMLRTAANLI
jgi:integrase/recombinase XerD